MLNGARVGEYAIVVDSAVMGRVGAFAQVESCLVGQEGEVRSGAVLRDAKIPESI
ncbi:MAG: hypothetical protein ACKOFM_09135 [Actinomycetota bacterium]